MVGLVERWAGQVVHGGINNAKAFVTAGLEVEHLGEADPGIADQRAARLDHQVALAIAPCIKFGQQRSPSACLGQPG